MAAENIKIMWKICKRVMLMILHIRDHTILLTYFFLGKSYVFMYIYSEKKEGMGENRQDLFIDIRFLK